MTDRYANQPVMALFIGKPEYLEALDQYYLGYNDYKNGIIRDADTVGFWYNAGLSDGREENKGV